MNRRSFMASVGGIVLPGLITGAVEAQGPSTGASVRFVDITEQAGIHFRHNSAPEQKYIVESMSGGVALFDYDNDGWLDIYFTNALTVATANDPKSARSDLYHNNGDGTFTDVTQKAGVDDRRWSTGAAFGDYDRDGALDLFVTNYVDF